MERTARLSTTAVVGMVLVLPLGSVALGQGATSLLEEVVVTARRREESLQVTPIAITALSGDNMDSMGIEDSRDLARFVPNMGTMTNGIGGALGDNYVIRGIGTDRIFPDSESGVGIYIDDVFFPRVAANVVDIVELERVEVLRGPQGTLFGRNSMAGTIRYVTKKPTGELGGNVRVTTGELNRLGARGSIDFPISDNWAGLVSFGQDRRDGYITHEFGPGTNGSKDNTTIRGKLRYESDRLTVDLGYTDTSTRSNGTPIVTTAVATNPPGGRGYAPFVSGYNNANLPAGPFDQSWASQGRYSVPGNMSEPDFANLDQKVFEMTINYDISDSLTFRSITASTELDYVWSQDMDGSELTVFTNRFSEHDEVIQQEFQLLGEGDRFNWQAGVFLYDEQPDYSQWSTAQGQESGAPRIRDQNYSTDAWAVFAQGTYAFNDRLSLTAGVRHTDEQKDIFSILTVRPMSPLEGLSASNSASWSATTPMVSLSYQANDDLMLFGSYAEGFRSGGINFNINQGPVQVPNLAILPFDPEDAENLEFGAKWNSADGGFIVNTAVFFTKLAGQQLGGIINFPGGFIGQQVNAGDSSMQGIEVELRGNVSDTFQLRATAAYLDASFDSVGTAVTTITINSELANAPEFSYTLGGTAETPLSNGGALGFNFDYTWRDKTQAARNFNNELTLPELGLLSASLSYYLPGDQMSVTLAGTNLTDEYYFTTMRDAFIGAPFGTSNGTVGRPRELSISANFRF